MRKITYAEAINETLREMMRKDERIFIMGEDIGRYGGVFQVTKGLLDEFGEERIIDTPISEAGFVGAGTGAALTGMRPVVELMFIDFTTLAMDQIVNQAAKIHYMFGGKAKIPLVLRTNIGAGRGAAAQHSQSLHAWFVHAPGLKVVLPSSSYDVKGLLVTAIEDDNPVMFIEHKMLYYTEGEVPEELYSIPFGKGEVKREGKDLTIVALSSMVGKALRAAEDLAKNGIDVEVVDPRTLVPLDEAIIFDSVKKTGRLLVADEGHKRCGIGAEIAATVSEKAFDYLDAPILRVASPDVPVPFSHPLEEAYIPDEEDIKRACHELFTK
ncbi:alpha-ketoacid dehydrogenase subunit beta [Candidatus Aerophobetes bacterium]|uniref:Alpha-ketoacid dehydrogenase subunit beta n=1 Tax=Aerophobetes bacterium TaxID=2030807 RepID=A0A523W093_UNCAE|nr:MAG: alpha-ketoacid dehydrogenase subunit beta [Candidatus Aerophobetes bacterium]